MVMAMFLPLIASAQSTNKAISASTTGGTTHNRLHVPMEAAGIHRSYVEEDYASFASSYSVGMWFKLDKYFSHSNSWYTNANYCVLADFGTNNNSNNNGNWAIYVNNNGVMNLKGHGSDNHGVGSVAGQIVPSVSLNDWHYLLLTIDNSGDNGVVSIYYDGEQVASKTATCKIYYNWNDGDTYDLHFAGYGFNGALDEVQLWNKALSADEATAAYANASSVSGLTALYSLDEEASTGTFANEAIGGDKSYNATYNALSGKAYSDGGLVPVASHTPTTPTLVDGREIATEANVIIMESEGGMIALTNGETEYTEMQNSILTGTQLTVKAIPEEGYQLIEAYVIDMNMSPIATLADGESFKLTGDVIVTGRFTNETYALTIEDGGATCTVKRGNEVVTDLSALLGGGAPYTLTVEVPEGKRLVSVKQGNRELEGTDGVYEFFMDEDCTITVTIADITRYAVTFVQPENGTVGATYTSANGEVTLASGDEVLEGTVISLTSAAEAGYILSHYTINGERATSTTYTVNEAVEISAVFEEGLEYCEPTGTPSDARYVTTLNISDNNGNSQNVAGNGAGKGYTDRTSTVFTTNPGSEVTVKVTAGAGSWQHSYFYIDYGRDGVFDVDATKNVANGDLVTFNYYGPNGENEGYNSLGEKQSSSNKNVVNGGLPSFTIPADLKPGNYRARFRLYWNNVDPCANLTDQGTETGKACFDFTICVVSDDYETPRTITVKSADETMGTVAITDPATEEASVSTTQKNVTVKATPAEDVEFINWTNAEGAVVANTAEYSYNGEEDIELTANFGYQLTYTASSNGRVSATVDGVAAGSPSVLPKGSEVEFTFTPAAGYAVSSLIVNNVDVTAEVVENAYTLTLNSKTEISVTFAELPTDVNWTVEGDGEVMVNTEFDIDTLEPTGKNVENGGDVNKGDMLGIYFKPAEGSEVKSFIVNGQEYSFDEDPMFDYSSSYGLLDNGYFFYGIDAVDGPVTISVVFSTKETEGIEGITADENDGPVEYFNLQGVRVNAENLTPGFYIVRQGSKVSKVYINK